jgi:ribosomal protein S18 acetylase RimI-like enzyme
VAKFFILHNMSLLIREIPPADAPIDLLLLADPSEAKVRASLTGSQCFVAVQDGATFGACVLHEHAPGVHELMSIAVQPAQQRGGVGSALLRHVIAYCEQAGATVLEVGTGAFGYQLAFYQRHGFRVTAIDRDFFVRNYPEPVFEDGIRHFDMLRLSLAFPLRKEVPPAPESGGRASDRLASS